MLSILSPKHGLIVACIRRAFGQEDRMGSAWIPRSDEATWERLYTLALQQGITPLVYAGLKALQVEAPDRIQALLRAQAVQSTTFPIVALKPTLQQALAAMASVDLEPIVLKGAALAYTVYPQPTYRTYGDVDLLLSKNELHRAKEALIEQGFLIGSPDPDFYGNDHHHLPPLFFPKTRISVELHHHLVVESNPFRIDITQVRKRTERRSIAGYPTRVLAPVDALHHACIHMSYGHAYEWIPIRSLTDILAITTRYRTEFDWDTFVQIVRSAQTAGAAYWPLRMSRDWFGAPVPDRVLAKLAPEMPIQRLLGSFAEPGFILEGQSPKGEGNGVLYRMLRDLSLYTGCSWHVQLKELERRLFPPPENVGHLPTTFTHERWRYAAYLASPRRLSNGLFAFGRLISRL